MAHRIEKIHTPIHIVPAASYAVRAKKLWENIIIRVVPAHPTLTSGHGPMGNFGDLAVDLVEEGL